jgi:cytochrome c oxidase subunit 1
VEQINLIIHNTLYVPGHFHGTVVAGTTLAFMGITYPIINLIFRRELVLKTWAKWQPYLFAIGAGGISLFMMGAGTLGVSRRHWDITFSDAPLAFDYPPAAFLMMGLNGIFAVIATIGGIMYVVVTVGSILFGEKIGEKAIKLEAPAPAAAAAVGQYGSATSVSIPGTVVLIAMFFVSFVLYYFVNWKYVSELWPMR